MTTEVSASILYNFVHCPHRVWMDAFGKPEDRDPINAFVQLLWEKGQTFEQEVIQELKLPFTNLRMYLAVEKLRLTVESMRRGDPLIYGGRIQLQDLVGEPDLLRREGLRYVAGDIKSGAGKEGGSEDAERKPKKHYAVQLALYTDILEQMKLSAGRSAFIWDVHGEEVLYDFGAPQGSRTPTTLWQEYQSSLAAAREILEQRQKTQPALGSTCKLCHWRTACRRHLEAMHDLTFIHELGRSKRDALSPHVSTVEALAKADIAALPKIPGVGQAWLKKFQARAALQIQQNAQPYLTEALDLPRADLELFFDVETDPMQDVCYLHGFVERHKRDNASERYVPFMTDTPDPREEERVFAEAWDYVRARGVCVLYFYSAYERTTWRKLQARYPGVASEKDIEAMFAPGAAVDLYNDVVRPKTEWPTHDYSVKTLASHLGFKWRDPEPSGAASVEWYHRWLETHDPAMRQRILAYNEDDCRAMGVLLDGVRRLTLK